MDRNKLKPDDKGQWVEWGEISVELDSETLRFDILNTLAKVAADREDEDAMYHEYGTFDKEVPTTFKVDGYATVWAYRPYTEAELKRRKLAKERAAAGKKKRAETIRQKELATARKLAEKYGLKIEEE